MILNWENERKFEGLPKGAGIVPICRSAANLKKRVGSAEMVVENPRKRIKFAERLIIMQEKSGNSIPEEKKRELFLRQKRTLDIF